MKKASRAALQAQIDTMRAEVGILAWLHAERDYHLLNAFNVVTNAINTMGWLHAERAYHLEQFIDSEQRLIARARAVKAAKTQAEQNAHAIGVSS